MVWYGIVWYGISWHGVVLYAMVCYGVVWYYMVLYGIAWHGTVWYGRARGPHAAGSPKEAGVKSAVAVGLRFADFVRFCRCLLSIVRPYL